MHLETLDLHGYTVADAMLRLVSRCNKLLAEGSGNELLGLEVIHGKGKGEPGGGAIRDALREYLSKHGRRIKGFDAQLAIRGAQDVLDRAGKLAYIHGEDLDGNRGKTIVIPRQRISLPRDWLKYR